MPLFVDERRFMCWPAALILTAGRPKTPFSVVMDMVGDALRVHRWRSDEPVPSNRLKIPARADEVLDWLRVVWQRLERAGSSDLLSERRSLIQEIVQSSVAVEDHANIVKAVGYLARLVAARKRSRRAGTPDARIPVTRSPLMQAAYLKMVSLASTDMPVWLAGEKGTELEWAARLIHQLRGLPDSGFVVVESRRANRIALANIGERFAPDVTLFLSDLEDSSESVQQTLHRHLITELTTPAAIRITVCTSTGESPDDTVPGVLPELLAFLSATRIDIPPLRRRMEDLLPLISFVASEQHLDDPVERFTREAVDMLQRHHWPGNVRELEVMVAFLLQKRPSGPIRSQDLPEPLQSAGGCSVELMVLLQDVLQDQKFRILRSPDGRCRLAEFLRDHGSEKFGASDVQRSFQLGRETVRKLLHALQERGVIEGIQGVQGKRTTRYIWADRWTGQDRGIVVE